MAVRVWKYKTGAETVTEPQAFLTSKNQLTLPMSLRAYPSLLRKSQWGRELHVR